MQLSLHGLSSYSIFILFRQRNSSLSRVDSFVNITLASRSVSICSSATSVSLESFPVSVGSAGRTTSKLFKSVFAKYKSVFSYTLSIVYFTFVCYCMAITCASTFYQKSFNGVSIVILKSCFQETV